MRRLPVLLASLALVAGCGRGRIERVEWTVMGTVAAVQFRGGIDKGAVEKVKASFAEVERLLNAHDPRSEIRRLAVRPDGEILASCDASVRPCYAAALEFRRQTGGAFDPRWRGPGTFDLGGIAKGFAVDVAAAELKASGVALDTLVDLGGNLKSVRGEWEVGVHDPAGGEMRTFRLAEGAACATSAEYFRGRHIRDPRTGEAPRGDVVSVTVIDPESAMSADGWSTALFVLGRDAGEKAMSAHRPAARAIWQRGTRNPKEEQDEGS